MTRPIHCKVHAKIIRDKLLYATEMADKLHEIEKNLVDLLKEIDDQKFYIRFGYKSLMGFCNHGLKFTKTQSQRITTLVRRD